MSSQPRPQLHRSQPYKPINITKLQPHSVDQDTLTIDQRLSSANSTIGECLYVLSSNRETITNLTQDCKTYEHQLKYWSRAYKDLETEHRQTGTNLKNITRSYHTVSQQLEDYEFTVQEYKRELQAALGLDGQNITREEMREHQTALAQANDELATTKKKLNEMREMNREHQSNLRKAHCHLDTICKEKEDLIQEYRDALILAEDRAETAEKRIFELEEQQSNEQMSVEGKIMELEKKVDSIREHRDSLAGAWEAAEEKVAKPKEKKAYLIQDRDALATAKDAAGKRIAELEKENAQSIQEQRVALDAAKELEYVYVTAAREVSPIKSPVASLEAVSSPNIRKRPRFESKEDGDMQQQHRKLRRREAAKTMDRDTVIDC